MSGLATCGDVVRASTRCILATTAVCPEDFPTTRMAASAYLMPAGSGLTIPRLDGIPQSYRLWQGEQTAARAAAAFLRADIASPADWDGKSRNPFEFLKRALDRWTAEHGASEIRKEFQMSLTLSTLDTYSTGDQEAGAMPDLYLILEPESAGYVVLGPTLRLLETVHPCLPVTFVQLFAGALNRWIRVYDWRDALDRVERLREWYEMDVPEDGGAVELPDIGRSIPPCMKRRPLSMKAVKRLCRTVVDSKARRLIEEVLQLAAISSSVARPVLAERDGEKLVDCGEPLPAMLAVFEKDDAIEGQFDEESEGMLELTPEPNLIISMNGIDEQSVRQAFEAIAICCKALASAAKLINMMPSNASRGRS